MVVISNTDSPRRSLGPRQAATVERLLESVETLLQHESFGNVTMRTVAKGAGVSAATAYTYFTSKEHLVAELLWRRLQAVDDPTRDGSQDPIERCTAVLSDFATLVADEPYLARACSESLIADDPAVHTVRDLIGAEMHRRLVTAAGVSARPEAIFTLELVVSGALIRAGTGHSGYRDLPAQLGAAVEIIMKGST